MSEVRAIGSRSNPLWQRLRKLAQNPTGYREQAQIWIEGEHLCSEVVQRGRIARYAVIGEPAWEDEPLRRLAQTATTVLLLPAGLMAAMSGLDSPPPLAFVLPWAADAVVQAGLASVVLDHLQDAGNVGTIVRSAAAFGFGQVIALQGTAALWSPKVLRAGMGAHFALHLVEGACEADLGMLGLPLLATSSHAELGITDRPLPWPCAWVMGHEGRGLSPGLQARCDQTLRIPQPGGMESLNVAAAASVCLYESARQRLSA